MNKLKEDPEHFPYPHKFQVTHSIPQLREEFIPKCQSKGVFLEQVVAVAGRIFNIRSSGKHLVFYDIEADDTKVQIMANAKLYDSEEKFEHSKTIIGRGDIVGVRGKVGLSKTGEFSVAPSFMQLLAPCLHMLPKAHYGLTD